MIVTVYEVEYKQTVNRGTRHQRVNWILLGSFRSRKDAENVSKDVQDSRVVERDVDEDWAYDNCDEIEDTTRDCPHFDM